MIKQIFGLFLATLLLMGFSPQQKLITNASNKTDISNSTLEETATANATLLTKAKEINEPIVFIDGETGKQLDEVYQLAKDINSFNNPLNKLVNEFFMPERLSSLTPLEIIDIPLTFCLFGSIATKSITKAPKIAKVATKLTRSDYINLGATDLLNKAVRLRQLAKEEEVAEGAVKVASQAERYGALLKKHIALKKEIALLEKAELETIKAGKKGISILQKIEDKTRELIATERKLDFILAKWRP